MRFSPSSYLLMCLSLETLTIIIRVGLPILVKLIALVNSVIIFLSQTTLLRWLTFLLGSLTVILKVLLCWIYFFLLMLVFLLQWFSLHWEILIMLLSQFTLTFHHIHNKIPRFIALPYDYSCTDCDHLRDIPWEDILKSVLLLLLVNFLKGFRWQLMYISLIECIRSRFTHLHDLQLLALLS